MAAGTKIIFEFKNAAGNTVRHSYSYGNAEATSLTVKNYMNAAIANKEIFQNPPVSISRAYAQITTESEYDLSD